jgi:hypothetical protein
VLLKLGQVFLSVCFELSVLTGARLRLEERHRLLVIIDLLTHILPVKRPARHFLQVFLGHLLCARGSGRGCKALAFCELHELGARLRVVRDHQFGEVLYVIAYRLLLGQLRALNLRQPSSGCILDEAPVS